MPLALLKARLLFAIILSAIFFSAWKSFSIRSIRSVFVRPVNAHMVSMFMLRDPDPAPVDPICLFLLFPYMKFDADFLNDERRFFVELCV